jgi:hypothetical protein
MNASQPVTFLVIALTLLMVACTRQDGLTIQSETAQTDHAPSESLSQISYTQIYASSDGETHFRDVTVPLTRFSPAPPAQPFAQSALQSATTIRHAAFEAHWGVYDRDHNIFHNASERRFVSVRRGISWVRTSDGETRQFHPGDVFEAIDVAPSKGHITWVGDEPSIVLFSNHTE